MSDRFTKENYKNIQDLFIEETGVKFQHKYKHRSVSTTAKVSIICACLIASCVSAFATDTGQAIIEKLFFNKPVESEEISSGYKEPSQKGTAENDIKITDPGHKGIDIKCDKGTPVTPVLPGKVTDTGYNSGYGNYIVISHEENYTSKYAHLESILVEIGQEVDIDTQIGTAGSTGMSTGPHLHLEMTHNEELIDPSPYLFSSPAE